MCTIQLNFRLLDRVSLQEAEGQVCQVLVPLRSEEFHGVRIAPTRLVPVFLRKETEELMSYVLWWNHPVEKPECRIIVNRLVTRSHHHKQVIRWESTAALLVS